jgi:DNA-binding transcriptional LysR family regulator
MLRLRQLEVFRAVMANGSVSGAARVLRMSQPAATAAVRALERSIGLPLFQRTRGRLLPTPEAEGLYQEADRVFRSLSVVEKYAHDLKEAQSGVLALACTPSLAVGFLTDAIAAFRTRHPRVHIWLQITTTRDVIDLAQTRQIDLGFIYAPANEAGLTVVPLFTVPLVCVLSPAHELAARSSLGPRELKTQPLIINVRNDPIVALLETAFQPLDLRRMTVIGTNQTAAACALADAGAGIAIVEPLSVARLFPSLAQRPFRPRIAVTVRQVSSELHPLSHRARQFSQELKQRAHAPGSTTSTARAAISRPPAAAKPCEAG